MKPVTHDQIDRALDEYLLAGGQVRRLYPSHVTRIRSSHITARTRDNLIDKTRPPDLPDNLFDLMVPNG